MGISVSEYFSEYDFLRVITVWFSTYYTGHHVSRPVRSKAINPLIIKGFFMPLAESVATGLFLAYFLLLSYYQLYE